MSGVKNQLFLFVRQYVAYVINFEAFCILLNFLNDTSKGIFISFSELIFVLNRHKDHTSLSTTEIIGSS